MLISPELRGDRLLHAGRCVLIYPNIIKEGFPVFLSEWEPILGIQEGNCNSAFFQIIPLP